MELGLCLLSCLTWIDLLKHFSTPKIGMVFFFSSYLAESKHA